MSLEEQISTILLFKNTNTEKLADQAAAKIVELLKMYSPEELREELR